jgi:ATP-dependent RNA helicase RhlE
MDFALTHFSALGLAEPVLRALVHEGYETPTPIQERAIPPVLEGHDLLGLAQTGTGKTAAFATPILTRLLATPGRAAPRTARALVLAPTRELAAQIASSFKAYARFTRMSVACVFGGVGFGPQAHALSRGVDVLVATPGRLIDHLEQRTLDLSATHVVVLDEADHMLDLGFVKPIRHILARLPKQRQTLFFSATMPKEIADLAADMLHAPVQVAVTPAARTADRVAQKVIFVETGAKRDLLAEMLSDRGYTRTIVFTRTKRGADRVAEHLEARGVEAVAIHGNKSQGARTKALDGFKSGAVRVLVATDIAARGIDVDAVSHVVNFELPDVPEAYVHRIGRTARAGLEGDAISFCANEERDLLRGIERLTKQSIPSEDRRGRVASRPPLEGAAPRKPEGDAPRRNERPRHADARRAGEKSRPADGHRKTEAQRKTDGHRKTDAQRSPAQDERAGARPFRLQADKRRDGEPRGGEQRRDHAPRGDERRAAGPRRRRPAPQQRSDSGAQAGRV